MPRKEQHVPPGSFPGLMLINGIVHLRIGPSSEVWRLRTWAKKSFYRHGSFTVLGANLGSALVDIRVPRKGWNPDGAKTTRMTLLPRIELILARGNIYARFFTREEWTQIEEHAERESDFRGFYKPWQTQTPTKPFPPIWVSP